MKTFNVTGLCVSGKHYMVDISEKLKEIMKLVDAGYYFTINRARQYGKTTTLFALEKLLINSDAVCISISFESAGDIMFADSKSFCQRFLLHVSKAIERTDKEFATQWLDEGVTDFGLLGYHLHKLCENKKIILLVDEVDKTCNNRIFLEFLSLLRSKYLARAQGHENTFHSVILAGVHDIKNIKLKLVPYGHKAAINNKNSSVRYRHANAWRIGVADVSEAGFIPAQRWGMGRSPILVKEGKTELKTEERQYNSPWNIAATFKVEMSFNPLEISSMLEQYEKDHNTGMDVMTISQEIYNYTNGYPFLTSWICKYIDEELNKDWTIVGVHEAVKILISERNTLFDDLVKNLESYKNLYDLLYFILIKGIKRQYSTLNDDINIADTFGYIKNVDNKVAVSNKVFEMTMCEYFVNEDEKAQSIKAPVGSGLYSEITAGGSFDMELCLRRFAEYYNEIFSKRNISFLEEHGAIIFLSFLKPLVNGNGFYHIESQLIDNRRMDIVVDYGKEQFIIELKLWRGNAKRTKSYDQLIGYMEAKNAAKGYLVTFDLRKKRNREQKTEWVQVGGRRIFEVMV